MPLHAQLHRRQFNGALEPGYPVSLSREMANGDKERKKQSGPRSSRGPRPPCSLAHSGAAARNYFLGSLELPESSLSRPLCRELRVLLSRDGSGGAGTLLQEAWGWGWGISQTPRGGGPAAAPGARVGISLPPDEGWGVRLGKKCFSVPRSGITRRPCLPAPAKGRRTRDAQGEVPCRGGGPGGPGRTLGRVWILNPSNHLLQQ